MNLLRCPFSLHELNYLGGKAHSHYVKYRIGVPSMQTIYLMPEGLWTGVPVKLSRLPVIPGRWNKAVSIRVYTWNDVVENIRHTKQRNNLWKLRRVYLKTSGN